MVRARIEVLFSSFWLSLFLCFFAGSLSALAMAPANLWPVFLIGFSVLYLSLAFTVNKWRAFLFGWLWAFGYFVFSLSWIGNALLVDGNPYRWAWPLAVCGLPALLAFFNGFACLFAWRFLNLKAWHGYLGFVSMLSLFEYLRGHIFTGFPWNLYGYTWSDVLPVLQVASLESVYFLTFLTLLWLAFPGYFFVTRASKPVFLTLILSFAAAWTYGSWRLDDTVFHESLQVKIVQPNTPQDEKWKREHMPRHFETALLLSEAKEEDSDTTLLVWPETTLSPYFLNAPSSVRRIQDVLGGYSDGAVLLTGVLRHDPEKKTYQNSLIKLTSEGLSTGSTYDKHHLVPFGEYIPFQDWIPLAPIVQFKGFERGEGLQTSDVFDDFLYSPLICYEILFPHSVVPAHSNADFIVNVTNDAWYGDSAGPHQHLVKARFRAVEEGIPVIRAANTGVSALIDGYGRVLEQSELFSTHVVTSSLPSRITHNFKPYYFYMALFPLLPLLLLVLGVFRALRSANAD